MEFIVDINSVESKAVQFQVSPGEIVYCISNKTSKALLKGLIGDDRTVNGKVLGRDVSTHRKNLRDLRKEVGYVDEDMYLSREHSIRQNFELYLAGSKDKSKLITKLDSHLQYFGLDKDNIVAKLSPREVFYTKLCFCLAKNPKLVVIPKAFTFTSQSVFRTLMSHIYDLIMDGDITYIANVSDPSLTENFPGRVVTL